MNANNTTPPGTSASPALTQPISPIVLAQRRSTDTATRVRDARLVLAGRVLVANDPTDGHTYPHLFAGKPTLEAVTGLVAAGKHSADLIRALREAHPDPDKLVLLFAPAGSEKHDATTHRPFIFGDDLDNPSLLPTSIEDHLNGQLELGASVVVLPTGYVRAGDYKALRAVIEAANKIDRIDVVLHIPVDYNWLAKDSIGDFTRAMQASRHPVAISLGDRNKNPMENAGVLAGVRTISRECEWAMFWNTDLGGFEAMSHGAKAAAIGAVPSRRRAIIPGRDGFGSHGHDPHVLLPDLLRYKKSRRIRGEWFASLTPPVCLCAVCGGRPIDRYSGSDLDRAAAHRHNALGVIEMASEAQASGDLTAWWNSRVDAAIAAHTELGGRIGAPLKIPADLTAWSKR